MLGEQDRCGRDELLDVVLVDLDEQVFPRREVAVESALADPGLLGDRVELQPVRARDDSPRATAMIRARFSAASARNRDVFICPPQCNVDKRTHVRYRQ